MTILYSCIANGSSILCSQQKQAGTFEDVTQSMLRNIPTHQATKTSYTSANFTFHVLVENGIVYVCCADSEFGRLQPYAFLNEIKRKFEASSLSARAYSASPLEFNRDFAHVLSTDMDTFSSKRHDPTHKLQSQVEEVKGIMSRNIESVLSRGEKLEDLMSKSTDLEASSLTFKKSSTRLHRTMYWKNMKMKICIACTLLVIIAVVTLIILFSTGVLPPKGGSSGGDSSPTIRPITPQP